MVERGHQMRCACPAFVCARAGSPDRLAVDGDLVAGYSADTPAAVTDDVKNEVAPCSYSYSVLPVPAFDLSDHPVRFPLRRVGPFMPYRRASNPPM